MSKIYVHIVGVAEHGIIGVDGDLALHSRVDMRWFKACTLRMKCLSGFRNTLALPSLLPGRTTYTLIHHNREIPTAYIDELRSKTNHLIHAVGEIKETDMIMVIGGEKVYKSTSDLANAAIVTHFEGSSLQPEDGTAFYTVPEHLVVKEQVLRQQDEELILRHVIYADTEATLNRVKQHLIQRNIIGNK